MPGALSQADAQNAFADAINNITGNYNDCGYTDQVAATSQYMGTTTYEADMAADNTCAAYDDRDGQSTWDAGDLASGTLARTCWFFVPSGTQPSQMTVEADVRYNTHDWDFTDSPSTCTSQYDIRALETHEAGHVFGLRHAVDHYNLTMYPTLNPCETKNRTLGKGDLLGLHALY